MERFKKKKNRMERLLLAPFLFLYPVAALAVPKTPEQFKTLEEAFIFPCDEIGNDMKLFIEILNKCKD